MWQSFFSLLVGTPYRGGPWGMFRATEPHWAAPGTPFFVTFPTERARKRVKEWHEGIFMKEWMKALKKTKISFGSYGRLKLKFLCEIYSPLRLQLLFNWFNKVQIYMEPNSSVLYNVFLCDFWSKDLFSGSCSSAHCILVWLPRWG